MRENTQAAYSRYDDDSAIDLSRIAGALLQKFWLIILFALLTSTLMYFYSKATYTENYVSSATLAFTTIDRITEKDEDGNEIGVLTQKKHYTEKDVERYQFLLKSDVMVQKVFDALEGKYTSDEIEKSLSVTGTSVTGFFTVNVMSTDHEFCTQAIAVLISAFPDYLKSFDTDLGIDVIKNAKPPLALNESRATKKAFYGLVAGAALVVFLILASEFLSDTVKETEDIRNKINVKFLGAIPTARSTALMFTDESESSFAFIESFKTIRTKVESIAAEKGYKRFIITSTLENEGKTTVAANLACALAQKGRSVLLVDCDLRKPSIMRTIGIKDDSKSGLIQIINDQSTYVESIKFVKPLGIFVLPSGGTSTKSTELLDTDRVKEVFDKAAAEFDFVIIDTPPAHIVTDCLVVAPLADALIYTVK
ncbi:MAG TPA: polysaccharide biosynthesis tyrosine autokinase, partial [Clostridia bacterium]|nr:polysaccharide biosynthesis tyrosine autokinase [Clostridia bacterium]